MFRACISGCTQAIASASKHIHTSPAFFSPIKRTGARNKKNNLQKSRRKLKAAAFNRPSVILGTRAREEEVKWKNSCLANVLVNEGSLSNAQLQQKAFALGTVNVPKQVGFGVGEAEQEMLFHGLPVLTADMMAQQQGIVDEKGYKIYLETEMLKANVFAKILDLRNANAAGIAYVNRRRIIAAFSTPQNPFDTGRTEVQVALLTYKIRNLWNHLTTFKRDVGNRRNLQMLVHKRARLLRYLKESSRDRYETLLESLALDPESVEGELVV